MTREFGRILKILSCLSPYSKVSTRDLARIASAEQWEIARLLELLERLPIGLYMARGHCRVTREGCRKIASLVHEEGGPRD